jgi:dihydrofolate synthase/folylpolyglutamate synthase
VSGGGTCYAEALAYVRSLSAFGSHLGLGRVRRLLEVLGDPQLALRTIHVAGTNGKGSVAAMMASVLTSAGYRTGLYISPCWDFADQMKIDGRPIAPEEAAHLILEVARPAARRLAESGDPDDQVTEFEFVTALAILHATRHGVDFFVCEVGLGGRLDATNVFDRPALSVITSIGLDHTDRLGPTLTDIAAEKAGIIKRSTPVVSAPQGPEALAVLAAAVRRRGCRLYVAGRTPRDDAWAGGRAAFRSVSLAGQRFDYTGPGLPNLDDLCLPLLGLHQLDNAATALTALGVLKERGLATAVDARAVRAGMAATVWPGRFEVFGVGNNASPTGPTRPIIVIDGAHNPAGARALAATIRQVLPGRRILLVLGLLADKDVEGYLHFVLPPELGEVAAVWTCRPENPRAMAPEELARRVRLVAPSLPVTPEVDVGQALRQAMAAATPADVVCVAGSLYQVGLARKVAAEVLA